MFLMIIFQNISMSFQQLLKIHTFFVSSQTLHPKFEAFLLCKPLYHKVNLSVS